jgi:hypothetical protein
MSQILQKVIDLHQQQKLSDLQAILAGHLIEQGMTSEVKQMLESWLEAAE